MATDRLTTERVREMERLAREATPGEWHEYRPRTYVYIAGQDSHGNRLYLTGPIMPGPDATAIAAFGTDGAELARSWLEMREAIRLVLDDGPGAPIGTDDPHKAQIIMWNEVAGPLRAALGLTERSPDEE